MSETLVAEAEKIRPIIVHMHLDIGTAVLSWMVPLNKPLAGLLDLVEAEFGHRSFTFGVEATGQALIDSKDDEEEAAPFAIAALWLACRHPEHGVRVYDALIRELDERGHAHLLWHLDWGMVRLDAAVLVGWYSVEMEDC